MTQIQETKPPYQLIQLPKVGQPATVPATTPATTPGAMPDFGALLDGQVFGVPVKYLLIGAIAFLFMKK